MKRTNNNISYEMLSKRGDRTYNEDRVFISEERGHFVCALADGMGGQGNGRIASGTVMEAIADFKKKHNKERDFVRNAFCYAQKAICTKKAGQAYGDMMTTLVVLSIQDTIQWAHIGDSRLYCFQNRHLITQTLDHSVPQVLVCANEIAPEDIRHHPDRNRLLRAMGKDWGRDEEFVLSEKRARKGRQEFLLCSDGFWEHILEKDMERLLLDSESVGEWLHRMEKVVCDNGKNYDMDNYSAIAVWLES